MPDLRNEGISAKVIAGEFATIARPAADHTLSAEGGRAGLLETAPASTSARVVAFDRRLANDSVGAPRGLDPSLPIGALADTCARILARSKLTEVMTGRSEVTDGGVCRSTIPDAPPFDLVARPFGRVTQISA